MTILTMKPKDFYCSFVSYDGKQADSLPDRNKKASPIESRDTKGAMQSLWQGLYVTCTSFPATLFSNRNLTVVSTDTVVAEIVKVTVPEPDEKMQNSTI